MIIHICLIICNLIIVMIFVYNDCYIFYFKVYYLIICYYIIELVYYFDSFSSTFSEVLDLMLASISSFSINPLPLSLFHKLDFILTPFILNIINISLHSGIVPLSLKHAIIKPILKKPGLNIRCLSNYRPIYQLTFISKILERIFSNQLINYLNANLLFDTRQSAYRKFHSPETLLLSILDDFLNKLENNYNIQLILLDLMRHLILLIILF